MHWIQCVRTEKGKLANRLTDSAGFKSSTGNCCYTRTHQGHIHWTLHPSSLCSFSHCAKQPFFHPSLYLSIRSFIRSSVHPPPPFLIDCTGKLQRWTANSRQWALSSPYLPPVLSCTRAVVMAHCECKQVHLLLLYLPVLYLDQQQQQQQQQPNWCRWWWCWCCCCCRWCRSCWCLPLSEVSLF